MAVGNDVWDDVDTFGEQLCAGPHGNGEARVDEHTAVVANVVMRAQLVHKDVAVYKLEEFVDQLSCGGVVGSEDGCLGDVERHGRGRRKRLS